MPLVRRRDVLKMASLAAIAAATKPTTAFAGLLDRFFSSPARLTPAITPNDEFYVTSYRSPPTVRPDSWQLSITGLVERPVVLTYEQLLARPVRSEIVTLECVGNEVGGESISTAQWEGLSLKTVLDEAGVSSQAVDVVFCAADGYSDSIRLDHALRGDVLIAHKMNGVPLPQGHGFPARIIVPGQYGMKSVQWLTEIEVVNNDYLGYYQKKGWTDDAIVKTMSRIDVPVHGSTLQGPKHLIQGLAFAGVRGIKLVEVSTNEGNTWQPAMLDDPLSPYAWRFWKLEWQAQKPGRCALLVRATDGTGRVQSSDEREPSPDGATGLHQITVSVEM